MDPEWTRFTGNSNLPPFESSSEPGPSRPLSRSRVEQWTGDENVGHLYNFPHQQPGQGDLHMQPVGEMSTDFGQPFHSEVSFQQMGYPLYPPSERVDTLSYPTDNTFYHYSPPHLQTITSPGSQGANVPQFHINPAGLFGETMQGSGSSAQLPAGPSYLFPQAPTFDIGYREGDGITSQIAQPLQGDILFPSPLYGHGPLQYDSPYNRSMGASMDIQGAGSSSTAGNMPLYPSERAVGTDLYEYSTGEVIFPKNNPISCAEGGPSAPSFSDGASPLPARVASDTGNVLGRGPQVPQEQYAIMAAKGHFNRHDPIIFNLKDSNALGIPIMDALEGEAYRLMGAKDAIINLDKTSTSLRILWPGYHSWSKAFPTKTWKKPRTLLTRALLAKKVAELIKKFYNERCNARVDGSNGEWRIGPDGIHLDDLVLVSLRHVSQGSWQPILCLKNPRP